MPSTRPRPAKMAPPEETGQEAAFLKHLADSRRNVVIKMIDGEEVSGWIEYYDRDMIRLTHNGGPNLFIFKQQIVYLKETEPAHAANAGNSISHGNVKH